MPHFTPYLLRNTQLPEDRLRALTTAASHLPSNHYVFKKATPCGAMVREMLPRRTGI